MYRVISSTILSLSTVLLITGGLYFSLKLSFPQLQWKKIFSKIKFAENSKISPTKSLMVSLAARIGVGSLAGISLAIYIGGPGTIFWMWIIGIITSINTYCECYLGAKYQEKDGNNYKGGPSFYIEKGLKNKKLAVIYSSLIIIAYILGFMTIQANTITVSLNNYFNFDKNIIALLISILTFLSIINGLNSIVKITTSLVPFIGISYTIIVLLVIIKNINIIPSIITLIIKSAFNIKSFTTSFILTFIVGMQRSLFSTEAGLGTTSISSSTTYTKNKVGLGLLQILGVYFTIFIICTGTALIILTSNYKEVIFNRINGIELTQYALNYHLGNIGSIILLLSIFFLAYSTIIAGYYYGESNLKYLIKNIKKEHIFLLKLLTIIILFIGSLSSSSLLWNFVDILVELLAIINMYTLLKLRKEIVFDYKNGK